MFCTCAIKSSVIRPMQAASRADVFSSIIGKRIFSCPILESLEDFRTSFHALIGVATRFASKSVFLSAKLFRMSSGIFSSRSNADEMVIETCICCHVSPCYNLIYRVSCV